MKDEFLHDLRETWQSQDHDAAQVMQRLRRRRWMPHLAITAQLLGCAFAVSVGVWFLWRAAYLPQQQRLLFVLSAAVMLVAVPVLCALSIQARCSAIAWHDETPEMLLGSGVRRAENSLRALRVLRWHLSVIVAFVVILWLCQVTGLVHASSFLVFYTIMCAVACAAGGLWMNWRAQHLRSERDACARLLEMLRVNDRDAAA
jgi:FtsH-binding integral membrane protein